MKKIINGSYYRTKGDIFLSPPFHQRKYYIKILSAGKGQADVKYDDGEVNKLAHRIIFKLFEKCSKLEGLFAVGE